MVYTYLDHIEPTDQLKDPKSRLQEYLQAQKTSPVYEVVDIQGDAPHQHFKVECVVDGLPRFMVRVQVVVLPSRQQRRKF
jgi:ribonuclease-3